MQHCPEAQPAGLPPGARSQASGGTRAPVSSARVVPSDSGLHVLVKVVDATVTTRAQMFCSALTTAAWPWATAYTPALLAYEDVPQEAAHVPSSGSCVTASVIDTTTGNESARNPTPPTPDEFAATLVGAGPLSPVPVAT